MQGVIVVGGSGGIGSAICRVLARDGYGIAVFDPSPCRELTSPLKAPQKAFEHFAIDGADRRAVEFSVSEVEKRIGPVWGLVNSAGIGPEAPFLEASDTLFDEIMHANVKTLFVCCQVAARHMVTRREGRIVNILSTSSNLGFARLAIYDASKGAAQQLTRTMAIELGPLGIQVNGVAPGTINTSLSTTYLSKKRSASHDLERIPMGRIGEPQDVAEAVAFLMSPRSTWINGATLVVDGGHSITGLPFFEESPSA
jgi:NAD(P)-dependent dehydrogenase (short-subunit alcohol dehydrogenase family)